MKRLSDDGETVVVNVKMPRELRDRVDRYQKSAGLGNRSEAARTALERGLPKEGKS